MTPHELVDHFFRHESSKLIATLTRILGVRNLDQAEEIVQETLLTALQYWSFHPLPQNPAAWLTQTAKNKAIDRIRGEKHRREFAARYQVSLKSEWVLSRTISEAFACEAIADDPLRMIFLCCHPEISPPEQVALTLRLMAGLTAAEIGAAFLIPAATMQKRISRARNRLQCAGIAFELPQTALPERLDMVLATLYLMFNEGYNSSHGEMIIRRDLCFEALRLTCLLMDHPSLNRQEVQALAALMCLQNARFPARLDADGDLILLADQNRSLWAGELIAKGLLWLNASAQGPHLSRYHLEAGIAAAHCRAVTFAETNWQEILKLYDLLCARHDTPIVRLNRAIALAYAHGWQAGIEQLEDLAEDGDLTGYYLLHAALGDFYLKVGRQKEAAVSYAHALKLTPGQTEQKCLQQKLNSISETGSGP